MLSFVEGYAGLPLATQEGGHNEEEHRREEIGTDVASVVAAVAAAVAAETTHEGEGSKEREQPRNTAREVRWPDCYPVNVLATTLFVSILTICP